jgi:hypothetical protein
MKYILLIIFCGILFIGCSSTTVVTYRVIDITENPVGTKVGQVDRTQGGILEAAKNGGIRLINTVSIQNTDKYTIYYWPMIIGGNPYITNTMHKEEIIVTGD